MYLSYFIYYLSILDNSRCDLFVSPKSTAKIKTKVTYLINLSTYENPCKREQNLREQLQGHYEYLHVTA